MGGGGLTWLTIYLCYSRVFGCQAASAKLIGAIEVETAEADSPTWMAGVGGSALAVPFTELIF